ncbi:MAG: tyrosine-protein phosphatase [Steroidobacteraceae bacterium]
MIIVALRVGLLWITALGASAAPALDGEISWQPEEQGVLVDRGLPLEGGNNFRDLGGYQTAQGRQVVWGTLFRSGSMSGLTDADYALLGTLGIRVISDLRSTNERQREPTRWRGSAAPRRLERDYDLDLGPLMAALSGPVDETTARAALAGFYRDIPFKYAGDYRNLFAALLDGEAPLAVNCSAGKDRTGIAAALLLTALGVPRSDVVDDYLLSNRYYRRQPVDPEQLDPSTRFLASLSPAVVNILTSVQREFIDASFEAIEARHGSVEHYLEVELGVDESARVRLVELYTRPL